LYICVEHTSRMVALLFMFLSAELGVILDMMTRCSRSSVSWLLSRL